MYGSNRTRKEDRYVFVVRTGDNARYHSLLYISRRLDRVRSDYSGSDYNFDNSNKTITKLYKESLRTLSKDVMYDIYTWRLGFTDHSFLHTT